MGGLFSRPEDPGRAEALRQEQVNNDLRGKVIDLFDSQQLLVLGLLGSGKTSLINSFNHVINLSVDNLAIFQEVGDFAPASTPVTLTYATYGPKRKLYNLLKESNPLVWERAPTFFDIPGIDSKYFDGEKAIGHLSQLLNHIVRGQVKEFSDLLSLYDSKADLKQIQDQLPIDAWRPQSILCVLDLSIPLRTEFLTKVVTKVVQGAKKEGRGLSVFVILTKPDKVEGDKKAKIEEYTRRAAEALVIHARRVFVVENFLVSDWQEDGTMKSLPDKEYRILNTFRQILQPAFKPVDRETM